MKYLDGESSATQDDINNAQLMIVAPDRETFKALREHLAHEWYQNDGQLWCSDVKNRTVYLMYRGAFGSLPKKLKRCEMYRVEWKKPVLKNVTLTRVKNRAWRLALFSGKDAVSVSVDLPDEASQDEVLSLLGTLKEKYRKVPNDDRTTTRVAKKV